MALVKREISSSIAVSFAPPRLLLLAALSMKFYRDFSLADSSKAADTGPVHE